MLDHVFRRYDIRGEINLDFFIEDVEQFGRAFCHYIYQKKPQARSILLARDGRTHSAYIEEVLISSLQENGFDVLQAGICPTPALYFGMHNNYADAGIMITASHNGPSYNGFKVCLGRKGIWGEELQKIRLLCKETLNRLSLEKGQRVSSLLKNDYCDWLIAHFFHLKELETSAIIDCHHGTAAAVMPSIVQELNLKNVQLLRIHADFFGMVSEADPTIFENMQEVYQALKTGRYELGIGFDGDADRMVPMTHKGELLAGDVVLALFSQSILGQQPGAAIVYDMKCSNILERYIGEKGGRPVRCATGHVLIKEALDREKALLGGELSGHFYFRDRGYGYDDGIYAALRLLELLGKEKMSLAFLHAKVARTCATPELRIPCAEDNKKHIMDQAYAFFTALPDVQIRDFEGMHITLPYGWAIIRPSHTQPVICIRCEALCEEDLEKVKTDIVKALFSSFGSLLHHYLKKER